MARKSGTPSYSSYRGRNPRWKTLVAAALILVCLLSGAVLFMQRYLVYDEQGHARLQLPWTETAPAPAEVPELHIEDPEPKLPAQDRKLLDLAAAPLTLADWQQAQSAADPALDAVAVTLRQGDEVYFDAPSARPGTLHTAPDTAQALQALTAAYPHAVARMGGLEDSLTAQKNVEALGLKNTGGYIFYDGANRNWLDPSKPQTAEYLGGLLTDAAALGFDELLLTDFTFPTAGKLDKIAYPEAGRAESLTALLESLRKTLDQAGYEGVALSIQLTPETILNGGDQVAGIDLRAVSAVVDGIYAPCGPEQEETLAAAVRGAGKARFVAIK